MIFVAHGHGALDIDGRRVRCALGRGGVVRAAVKREGDEFTTWRIPPPGGTLEDAPDNFGIAEDPEHLPGRVRVAFKAPSRRKVADIVQILSALGARNVEMDDGIYGTDYYAVFFEDPDGNLLEVCVNERA